MHNLVIDLTHGGVKIAISLAKKGKYVYAYDIYNTLNDIDRRMLEIYGVDVIDLEYLKNLNGSIKIIKPIHLPMSDEEIKSYNSDLNYIFITHHEAVHEILSDWGKDIPKIEITGVKGKTSSVFMLKEILIDKNPLLLSSLGAILYENGKEIILKKNISITPANIKESIDLAYKIANPICEISEGKVKSENLRKYSSAIFESSLGVSGIGDVGLLTNIAENYAIAKNRLDAAYAKSQVFNCKNVAIEKESLDKYYSYIHHENINTFSINDCEANLYLENADYTLNQTRLTVSYRDVKTINRNIINGTITLNTFAPGKHHVSNVLGVILTSLILEIPETDIIQGLENYNGISGRTNKKIIENSVIIEEINPGINTEAIKNSVNMIPDLDNYYVVIGGDYGITCEEIDEKKVGAFLDTLECDLILTGDVGRGILEKMSNKPQYIKNYKDTYDLAINNNRNLLFIYRSDYSKLSQR